METIQTPAFAVQTIPDTQLIEREPQLSALDQYLEATIYSINDQFTDYGSGFPISTFDHRLGDFEMQNRTTTIGDIGRSLLVTSEFKKHGAFHPQWMSTRAASIAVNLQDLMGQYDAYHDGAFASHLDASGLPTAIPCARPANSDQHGMLLYGLSVAAETFPEWGDRFEELMKTMLYEGFKHDVDITRIKSYGEIPQTEDKIIQLSRHRKPPSKTKPADLFEHLKDNPEGTFQIITDLINTNPGIFIPLVGFMEDARNLKPVQRYKDQAFILLTLYDYMDKSKRQEQSEATNINLEEAKVNLLKAA